MNVYNTLNSDICNLQMFKTPKRHKYVICKGDCKKLVPPWITPDKCRNCQKTQYSICKCGSSFNTSLSHSYTMCNRCFNNRVKNIPTVESVIPTVESVIPTVKPVIPTVEPVIPTTNDDVDSIFSTLDTASTDTIDNVEPRYAIQVKLKGKLESHSHRCQYFDEITNDDKIKESIYFRATPEIIKSKEVLDNMMRTFSDPSEFNRRYCRYCKAMINFEKVVKWKLVLYTTHIGQEMMEKDLNEYC